MAGELLRPGVEIIQQFQSASPSFVRPTLSPCIVGPAFEVLNVLTQDGAINSKARYGDYRQLSAAITDSSFPDPRGNIDELVIQGETIRPFMLYAGSLNELPMAPGSAFLATVHRASKAAITTKVFGGYGLALTGKVLVLAIDQPARLDTSNDVTIIFSGTLTAAECAEEINDATGTTVATVVGTGDNKKVRIASPGYGAFSSVTVRAGGSANSVLEIGYSGSSAAHEERVEGAGFRGQDLSNNTTVTPWIEFFRGAYVLDGVATEPIPAKAGLISVATGTFVNARAEQVIFGEQAGQFPVRKGDFFFADGIRLRDGEVMKVESERFKVGTINTTLSVADSNGNYQESGKVYNEEKVGTLFDTTPFAPTYTYFRANNLNWKRLAPMADSVEGLTSGSEVAGATVLSEALTVPGSGLALAGLKIHYVVTTDGVETEGNFTFASGPFATVANVASAIGTSIPGVTATDESGKIRLTSTGTGRLQGIVLKADSTAFGSSLLPFSTTQDTVGTGKDVEFVDIPARLLSTAAITFPTPDLEGLALKINVSVDGGVTFPTTKTFTFPAGAVADMDALVAAMEASTTFSGPTDAKWFAFADAAGKLAISSTANSGATGKNVALQVAFESPPEVLEALHLDDVDPDTSELQKDTGEEELNGQTLRFKFDHNPHIYVVTFSANSLDLAVDDINAAVGMTVASKAGASLDKLLLTSPLKGRDSLVEIFSGHAATAFGISTNGSSLGSGRPFPDAYLDDEGILYISAQMLRDLVTGYPLDQTNIGGTLYIQYKALRLDVTAAAKNASVLRFSDVATLNQVLDPLTEDNPLGLGMFLCMINCPTYEAKGLGIDAVTAAAPEGTGTAWNLAAAMLEAEEVFAIVPLTFEETVHGMWSTHVSVMSQPEQGGERVVWIAKRMPTRRNPTIALSGTQANSTATANQMLLDNDPAPGLIAAGINPGLPIPESAGVYMEFEVGDEVRRYSVSSVSGPLVNFRLAFTNPDTNVDGFYSTVTLNVAVVNAAFGLNVRGASLVVPGSSPPRLNYALVADTVAAANESIKNRRVRSIFPDYIKTTINGIEKSLPSYYAGCCYAGMCASLPPQQGFTNYPVTGLTGVVGTDKFTKRQLNIMAGGGTFILMQEVPGGAVFCRHQVSTDVSSIETREDSITRVVDFTAKILRLALRKYIGTNVVDDQLLDSLGTTAQAVLRFEEDAGILIGSNLNNIAQDASKPDEVLADVTLEPPYPCNRIRLTLSI